MFVLDAHPGLYPSDRIAISADGKEIYYTEVTSDRSHSRTRHYQL